MNTVRNGISKLCHKLSRTFYRAELGCQIVLIVLAILISLSVVICDIVYVSYCVILFLLVYHAEFWRQRTNYFLKKLRDNSKE